MHILSPGGRWSDEHDSKERTDDGDRNMPLPQDHPTHALSLSTESADSRLQARKRMAICAFGFGAMDPRPNPNRRELLN